MERGEQWTESSEMLAAGSTEKLPRPMAVEVPQNAGKARSKKSLCEIRSSSSRGHVERLT